MEVWNEKPVINIYSDGGAAPNPGKGGYGVILEYKGKKKELYQGYQHTTNNRMELLGVISGLESLKTPSSVHVYTDSSYVVNAVEKKWINRWQQKQWMRTPNSQVLNPDLWKKLYHFIQVHDVSFHWVKGHNGHVENERCDVLATKARNMHVLLPDTGYETFIQEQDEATLF